MTRFVGTPLRGIEFSSVSDEAISARVAGDNNPRIRIDAGGRITWSPGNAAGDVLLYRDTDASLRSDSIVKAPSGIVTLAAAGAPTAVVPDGGLAVNTTTDTLYVRSGGEWVQVAQGSLPGGGLEGQILAKTTDANYDVGWIDNYTGDLIIICKNDSGGTITKGSPVAASGAVGDRIRIVKAIADGTQGTEYFLGLAAVDIANGAEGYVQLLGEIRQMNTAAYPVGTVLYISPTTAGTLTSTAPSAPNPREHVAIVTRSHATTGILFVRMWHQSESIGTLNDVLLTSPASNDVLRYDGTKWVNQSVLASVEPLALAATAAVGTATTAARADHVHPTTGLAVLGSANAFTVGGHTITNNSDVIGLTVIGNATQTANLFEVRNSAGTSLLRAQNNGDLRVQKDLYATGGAYIGSSAPTSATASVRAGNASVIGFIVRGAASQTANLQEWQNSAGSILARVNETGTGLFGGGVTAGSYVGGSVRLSVTTSGTSTIGAVIRGESGQTADLQQWQNSGGTVMAAVKSNGSFDIYSQATSATPLTITGISGQSSFLTLWRDSGANTRAAISATGNLIVTPSSGIPIEATADNPDAAIFVTTYTTSPGAAAVAGIIGRKARGTSSAPAALQSGDLMGGVLLRGHTGTSFTSASNAGIYVWAGSAWTTSDNGTYMTFESTANGSTTRSERLRVHTDGKIGIAEASPEAQLQVTIPSSTTIGLIVKGATSQTATLQAWKNSAGTDVGYITAGGSLRAGAFGNTSSANNALITPSSTGTLVTTAIDTNVALRIQNTHATPTADLTRWLNTSGGILASIGSDGLFSTSSGAVISQNLYVGTGTFFGSRINLEIGQADRRGIVIRGFSGQTANLQEWQRSDAVIRASISSDGDITGQNTTVVGILNVAGGDFLGGRANISTAVAGNVGLIIRGVASQTGDLQQWQNSAGTVIARVYSDGGLGTTGSLVASGTGYIQGAGDYLGGLNVQTRSASQLGLVVRGRTSQTGNLQEWQDSSGNILARVSAGGNVHGQLFAWQPNTASYIGMNFDARAVGVISQAAGDKALVIRGAASQTANLQEWQTWNGTTATTVASVDKDGVALFANEIGIKNQSSWTLRLKQSAGSVFSINNQNVDRFFIAGGGSIGINTGTQFGGGEGVIGIANAATVPTTDPTGGGILYSESGALKWRSSGGAVTTIATTLAADVGSYAKLARPNIFTGGQQTIEDLSAANDAEARLVYLRAGADGTLGPLEFGISLVPSATGSSRYVSIGSGDFSSWRNIVFFGGVGSSANGRVAIGGTSAAGRLHVSSSAPAVVGVVVRGAASQTADLQQWQSSDGAVQAGVNSFGSVFMGGSSVLGRLTVSNADAATKNIVVRRANSQTANMQEWQSDTGVVWSSVDSIGRFAIGGAGVGSYGSASLSVTPQSAGSPGVVVRGAASQTANLQEWQNSAGTVGTYVDSATRFFSARGHFGSGTWIDPATLSAVGGLVVSGASGVTTDTVRWLVPGGTVVGGVTAVGQQWTGSTAPITVATGWAVSGTSLGTTATLTTASEHGLAVGDLVTIAGMTPSGYNGTYLVATVPTTTSFTVTTSGSNLGNSTVSGTVSVPAQASVTARSAGTVGLVVKGSVAALTSANVQQWQDSSGNLLARVDSFGNFWNRNYSQSSVHTNFVNATELRDIGGGSISSVLLRSTAGVAITTAQAANVALTVQNTNATPTGNLTEWRGTGTPGTLLARVDSSGSAEFVNLTLSGNLTVNGTTTTVNSVTTTLDDPIITLGGDSAPSTDDNKDRGVEFRWHNGTSAKIGFFGWDDSTEKFTFIPDATNSSEVFSGALGTIDVGAVHINGSQISASSLSNSTTGTGAIVLAQTPTLSPAAATNIGLIVRGFASQSANLQEWQNSSSTVLAGVSSSGVVFAPRFSFDSAAGLSFTTASSRIYTAAPVTIESGATTTVPMFIRAAASQSASLQEWQNSSGTAMASVTGTNGGFRSTGISIFGQLVGEIARVAIYTANDTLGLAIRGHTTQTANLQEWQNNAGTVLGFFDNNGRLGVNTGTNYNASLQVNTASTTRVGAVIRGVASQTANLQEWQSSTGSVWASVDKDARFVIGGSSQAPLGTLTVVAASANQVATVIRGAVSQTANLQEWQNSAGTIIGAMSAAGAFSAVTKSFDIEHPTKDGMRLRYGSLEGPENGVYVRGKSGGVIELPDYWTGLVDPDSVTVQLTPIGKPQNLFVEAVRDNAVYVGGAEGEFFYFIQAERIDVDRLVVEYGG